MVARQHVVILYFWLPEGKKKSQHFSGSRSETMCATKKAFNFDDRILSTLYEGVKTFLAPYVFQLCLFQLFQPSKFLGFGKPWCLTEQFFIQNSFSIWRILRGKIWSKNSFSSIYSACLFLLSSHRPIFSFSQPSSFVGNFETNLHLSKIGPEMPKNEKRNVIKMKNQLPIDLSSPSVSHKQ